MKRQLYCDNSNLIDSLRYVEAFVKGGNLEVKALSGLYRPPKVHSRIRTPLDNDSRAIKLHCHVDFFLPLKCIKFCDIWIVNLGFRGVKARFYVACIEITSPLCLSVCMSDSKSHFSSVAIIYWQLTCTLQHSCLTHLII